MAFFLTSNYHLIDKTCSSKMFLQVYTIINSIKFNYLSENKAMYEGKIQLTRIWVYEENMLTKWKKTLQHIQNGCRRRIIERVTKHYIF